jgi:3-oxoacyl-[acyl-carrier-protein] synthase II
VTASAAVVATGAGALLTGDGGLAELATGRTGSGDPADPAVHLPGRGLRYKDRATRLGLAAARVALADAGLLGADDGLTVPPADVAVAVSSNLGNADTVCRVVETIAADGTRGTSPMDLPNASSNVIASSIAIRFGLTGPNLMLCNGETSGLDALYWARSLLSAGRCRYVVAVGVEPDNPVVRRLTGRSRILDGAAAVVLELAGTARDRGARPRLGLGAYRRAADLEACITGLAGTSAPPARWYTPDGEAAVPAEVLPGVPRVDLAATWGAASGALGVLHCAAAIGWFDGGGGGPVYAFGGAGGGSATAGMVFERAGV